ncbi:MAG: hypothetical protein R3F14_28015, partial [Polyangiaceae bacterium]
PLGTTPLKSPFTFEVPPNTLGFTLVATVPGNPTSSLTVGLDNLWAPDGKQLVKGYSLGPENDLFFYANYGILAVSVPQSDAAQAMPVQAGKWTAQLGNHSSPGPANAEIALYLRQTIDGQFHGGVLDVNVFIVPGAADPDEVAPTIAESYKDYGGMTLGKLTFYSLPATYDIIDETNFYDAFNETKIVSEKPALNVLYVGALTGGLDGAAGVSSGLPGVPVVHGSNSSGVIATWFGDDFDRIVLQHEGGHFGGLFHTTEIVAGSHDFLGDTPICNDVLDLYDACPDFGNTMFPVGGTGAGFSQMQIQVLRGSALYRGVYQPGAAPSDPFFLSPPGDGSGAQPWLAQLDGDAIALPAASAVSSAWSAGLAPSASRALDWLVCPHGEGGLPAMWSETQAMLAGVSDAALLQIAADITAPSHVRARAISALASRPSTATIAAGLSDIAASEGAPAAVRVQAIRAVSKAAASERAALKTRLGPGASGLAARVAQRLL